MPRKSLVAPTLFTLAGLALLIGLGTWQLQRLQWKEGLIAARQAGVAAPPVALPATLAAARTLEFHHVAVTGQFLNQRELYLYAASKRGDAGFHIVTPLQLSDGRMILIDRGFVPTDRKAPASRPDSESNGTVTVTGLLRVPPDGRPSWFTPDNRPAENEWYYVDLPAMAAAAGVATVLPFYVDADAAADPHRYPQGGQTLLKLPNNHLQYALTWYALAVTLLAFYILIVRRQRREQK